MKKLILSLMVVCLICLSCCGITAFADEKPVYTYEKDGVITEFTLESDTEVSCVVKNGDEVISTGSGTYTEDTDTFVVNIAGTETWYAKDESGDLILITAPQVAAENAADETALTAEDIKEIINAVLNEQQKEQAEKTANIIADKFNLNATSVYIFLILGLIVVFIITFLTAKIIYISKSKAKTAEKLLAIQALLSDEQKKGADFYSALKALDKDGMTETFAEVVKPVIADITPEVIKGVEDGLQLDKAVLTKVLGTSATTSEQVNVIIEALKVLALKANQTEMANILTKSPTADAYAEVVMENEKLKAALGDDAVQKVIK